MIYTTKFDVSSIPDRVESPRRYDGNREVNVVIMDKFEKSKEWLKDHEVDPKYCCKNDVPKMLREGSIYQHEILCGDIPYGSSNLRDCGCAIFCAHQGLQMRYGCTVDISELAQEAMRKSYYKSNVGTYHNLFDHLGCRRCNSVFEVIEGLEDSGLITLLVKNSEYHGDSEKEGNHFVNLVGITTTKQSGLIAEVDDSNLKGTLSIYLTRILNATIFAWEW